MNEDMKQAAAVDIAWRILKKAGQPIYFRDLIMQVLESKGRPIHGLSQAISEVHTQINMDSRFVHSGKGMWGISEWAPPGGRRSSAAGDERSGGPALESRRRERLLEEIQQDGAAGPDTAEQNA